MKRIIAGMLAIAILAAPCAYDAFSPEPCLSPLSWRCQRFLASYKSDYDCVGSPRSREMLPRTGMTLNEALLQMAPHSIC